MELNHFRFYFATEDNAPAYVRAVVSFGPLAFAFNVPMALARDAYANLGAVLRRAEQAERAGRGGVGRSTDP